jgi:hypothetical protein
MSTVEMNVKEAVQLAFVYVQELFEREQVSDLGLEEVEYDDTSASWLVTVGFSRPWDVVNNNGALAALSGVSRAKSRSFKVVKIKGGRVVSLRDRSKALA